MNHNGNNNKIMLTIPNTTSTSSNAMGLVTGHYNSTYVPLQGRGPEYEYNRTGEVM
jgi:hypothetical protein